MHNYIHVKDRKESGLNYEYIAAVSQRCKKEYFVNAN
jgi:hypothetical protein